MTESSQRRSYPRYIILGLVASQPLTGYEIKKWVDCSVRFFWDISYGQIYPTLRQLSDEGLLTMEEIVQKTGPVKKVYTITPAGKDELLSWLSGPEEKDYEILLKLFFGRELADDVMIMKLSRYIEKREQDILFLEEVAEKARLCMSDMRQVQLRLMVNLFGRSAFQNEISWANDAIETIQSGGLEARNLSKQEMAL